MPRYEITAPDGHRYEITAPEGTSEQEALEYFKSTYQAPDVESDLSPMQDFMMDAVGAVAKGSEMLGESGGRLSKGALEGIGFLPDMANIPLKAVGLGSDKPFLGAEFNKDVMRRLGAYIPDTPPENTAQSILEGVGGAIGGAGGLMAGLAKPLAKFGAGKAKDISQDMLQSFAGSPAKTLGIEAGFGGIAGAGGQASAQLGEEWRPMGELTASLTPYAAMRAMQKAPDALAKTLFPFSEEGAMLRARDRLAGSAEDIGAAKESFGTERIAPVSPLRSTEDPRLIALEQNIRRENPDVDLSIRRQEQEASGILRGELDKMRSGDAVAPRLAIEGRVGALTKKIDAKVESSVQKMRNALTMVNPDISTQQASAIARRELEDALATAKKTETRLYNRVGKTTIPTTNVKNAYKEITQSGDYARAQIDQLPAAARRYLDPNAEVRLKNWESLNELKGIRTVLREQAQKAEAVGDATQAGLARKLERAITDDFRHAEKTLKKEDAILLREANDYSRYVHERFDEGIVGDIFKVSRQGTDNVDSALTLQKVFTGSKDAPDVALQQLLRATSSPDLRNATTQYIMNDFQAAAVRDGVINPALAQTWLRRNDKVLDTASPELAQQMRKAVQSSVDAKGAVARGEGAKKAITSRESMAQQYLNRPIGEEIGAVYAAKNPAQAARNIRNMMKGDKAALEGLNSSFVDDLIKRAEGSPTEGGVIPISGKRLMAAINDKKTNAIMNELLPKQQIATLRKIAKELDLLEKSAVSGVEGILQDTPSAVLESMVRVQAAKFGGAHGGGTMGGSLQTAGMATGAAKKYLGKLTNDSARQLLIDASRPENKHLLKAILSKTKEPKQIDKNFQVIGGWLTRFAQERGEGSIEEYDEYEEPAQPTRIDVTPADMPQAPLAPQSSLSSKDFMAMASASPFDMPRQSMPQPKPQQAPQMMATPQVTPQFLQKLAMAESSGNPLARAKTSSAKGLYQFTDGTWRNMVDKYGAQLGVGYDDIFDPQAQTKMAVKLAQDNGRILQKTLGRLPNDGELYAAHFLGAGGAVKMLKAKGTGKVAAKINPAAAKANRSIFFDGKRARTVDEVLAILNRKVA